MANNIQTKTQNKSIFKIISDAERQKALEAYEKSSLWDKKNSADADFTKQFFTLKEVKLLERFLDIIYPKSKFSPSELQAANDDIIDLGTIVKYHPRDLPESKKAFALAFVARVSKNIFKIFINEDCEDEAFDSMDLHEKGHILFNHTQSVKFYVEEFREGLEKVWDSRLAKYFDQEIKNNPKNKDKIVHMLFREFSNIAQDMEINSKLFDGGEWFKAKKTMSRSGMIVYLKYLKNSIDDMSGMFKDQTVSDPASPQYRKLLQNFEIVRQNIKTRLNGEEGDFQFCYPGNKGWPLKLDWMTYMILLVKDLDETMQQVMKNIKAAIGASGQGQGGNQPLSQDVLDAYANQQGEQEEAQESEGEGEESSDDDSDFEHTPTGRSPGGRGRGKGSGSVEIDFECCNGFDDFTKFLRKTCIGKKNRKWNSDVLYNSNRGKFASRVVVPRRHLIEKWMPQSATFVIDISGSVNSDLVEKAINSIIDTASGIDLGLSHIIFCDTRVTSDEVMSKRTKKIYSGGGTEIANGIAYVAEKGYCKKATDYLFVISDFQDHLIQWVNEAEKLHCQCFAIGYGYSDKNQAAQVVNHGYGDSSGDFKSRWNRKFKTIFIM